MGFFQTSGILNRRGFFGSKIFSPKDISDIDLWLDASDGNTLYDATSGGNLVTADGSAVKRWEDKSGNSNHATEGTNAPVLETAEKNGLNALNFASSKYLTNSFTSKLYTSETVFAVFRFSTSTPSFGRIFTQSILNDNDYAISGHYIPILRNATNNQICSYAGSAARSTVSASNNTWYIARARHSGSALTLKLNASEGASYSHTLNRNFAFYRIGGSYVAPSGGTDAAFLNSLISEIILSLSSSLTSLLSLWQTVYST